MNILFICDEYPPGKNGGIGTSVQMLGRELVKQGHSVYVAGLYRYRYGEADYEEDRGVKVWRKRFGLNLGNKGKGNVYNLLEKLPPVIRRYLNGTRAFNKYIKFLHQLIAKENIAVIEIPDWNNFAFFIGFVVRWPAFQVPLILKSHGSYTYFNSQLNLPLNTLLKTIDLELYKRADAFSAVSKYTANENKKLFHLSAPVKVLYNGIDVSESNLVTSKNEQTVIFIGTLIAKKGIFQLMKAWNTVHKKMPDAKLLIFGKGKTDVLKDLLDKESLNSVVFKGHVSRTELFVQLSEATLAVFPSYSETFGLMTIEAMSRGCPVIYTQRSCGPEIIQDKENGVLVDPDNIDEISSAIIELIENKSLQKKYSVNGKKTVDDKFNIVNLAKQHEEYYMQIINEFRSIG